MIENISIANGLPSTNIYATFQDKEDNYWFASSNGLSKLTSFENYSFSYDNKPVSGSETVVIDKFSRLWFWDGTFLYVLTGTQVSKIDISNTPFKEDGMDDMVASATGSLFIINRKGLYELHIDDKNINLNNAKLKIDFLKYDISLYYCIMEDKDMILVDCNKGLFAFKNNQFTKCIISLNDKKVIKSYKIVKDRYGYYWMGDFNFGLYRLHLKEPIVNTVEFDSIKVYKSAKHDSSFVTTYAGYVTLDYEGNLWMSSYNTGIYKLKIDRNGVTDYKLYSMKDGLSGSYINQKEEDNQHNIWVTTKRGANCIKLGNKGKDTVFNFNSKQGLGDEVFKIIPTDSLIYISYSEGFYAINIKHQNIHLKGPPPVIISQINIMGKLDSVALQSTSFYKLRHDQNFLSFDFASVSFTHENGIMYQYKLEGVDKDWSAYSDRRFVSYNSLPPGKYTFKIRSKTENGLLSAYITTFSFIILPPFYKTWWFIVLAVIIITSLGYSGYYYRVRQLLKLE